MVSIVCHCSFLCCYCCYCYCIICSVGRRWSKKIREIVEEEGEEEAEVVAEVLPIAVVKQ